MAACADCIDEDNFASLSSSVHQNPNFPDLRLRLGWALYQRGDVKSAMREVDAALDINPKFIDALQFKMSMLAGAGRLEEAIAAGISLVQTDQADPELLHRVAQLCFRAGRLDECISYAKRAVAIRPDLIHASMLLSQTAIHRGRFEEALKYLENIQRVNATPQAFYNTALLELKLERIDAAAKSLQKCLKLKRSHLPALFRLAMIHLSRENYQDAVLVMEDAVHFYPNYPDIRLALSKIYFKLGRHAQAMEAVETALQLNPDYADAIREKGGVAYSRHQHREAIEHLQESKEKDPDNLQTYINLAAMKQRVGEVKSAIEVLREGVRRFPTDWRLRQQLGWMLLEDKEYGSARVELLAAVNIMPALEPIQIRMRQAAKDNELLKETRAKLIKSFGSQSKMLDYQLGCLHMDYLETAQASDHFQACLDCPEVGEFARANLAIIHANHHRLEPAIELLRKEFVGSNLMIQVRRILLGLFCANDSNHKSAGNFYREVMSQAPLLFYALNGIGICFRETDDVDDDVDDYLKYAFAQDRSADVHRRLGELYSIKGQLLESLNHLNFGNIKKPEDVEIEYLLGVVNLLRLNFARAIEVFESVSSKNPAWSLPYLMRSILAEDAGQLASAIDHLQHFIDRHQDGHWKAMAAKKLNQIKDTLAKRDQATTINRDGPGVSGHTNTTSVTQKITTPPNLAVASLIDQKA